MYLKNCTAAEKLYVPKNLRTRVLRAIHWKGVLLHRGAKATESIIRKVYWWPGLSADVLAYTSSC